MPDHESGCVHFNSRIQEKRDSWAAAWPDRCPDCDARGWHFACPVDSDDRMICMGCAGVGTCPRCGTKNALPNDPEREGFWWDDPPCATCGFSYNDEMPERGYCICPRWWRTGGCVEGA